MLRKVLYYKTGSDDLFVKILRDFEHDFSGQEASTDDLRQIIERETNADWRPFFNSWINSADIPSYDWNYRQESGSVVLTIKRSGVAEGFTAFIPILIDYADGTTGAVIIPNQKSEQTVRLPVSKKIRNVTFAPAYSLLARIRQH
jgi:aminopeptidase N